MNDRIFCLGLKKYVIDLFVSLIILNISKIVYLSTYRYAINRVGRQFEVQSIENFGRSSTFFISLSVRLSGSLPVLSVTRCLCLSVPLSVSTSTFLCRWPFLSLHLCVCLSVPFCLSTSVSLLLILYFYVTKSASNAHRLPLYLSVALFLVPGIVMQVVGNCSLNNGGCQHECRDGPIGPLCVCRKGFRLQRDRKTCEG